MSANPFVMQARPKGRIPYVLLTTVPPIAFMYLFIWLAEAGLIPKNKTLAMVCIYGSLFAMVIVSYFLIWKKNHKLYFSQSGVLELSCLGRKTSYPLRQIKYYRRNFLNEYILTDGRGNKLFCVEPHMTNQDRFLNWLAAHNIESK